jgi:predicted RNase H-like HicB family nuclease
MATKANYPIIVTEHHDGGDYYTATSPNIPGLNVEGNTFDEAVYQAEDEMKDLVKGKEFPEALDPDGLNLGSDDTVVFIDIDVED